jgi:hypothetical protein
MSMPTDFGFRLQLVVTILVGIAVIWVGVQTGDWTGLVLVVPLAILVPIVAKLPAEPPARRRRREQQEAAGPSSAEKDDGPRRY